MKRKKHVFYCEKCDNPCLIYKKGKQHRVLVCPMCGILATNGKGTGKALIKRGAKAVLGEIPGASFIMEGVGAVGDVKRGLKTSKNTPDKPQNIRFDSADKPNIGERTINKVLYGE